MAKALPRGRAIAAFLLCVLLSAGAGRAAERWTEVSTAEVTVLTDGPAAAAEDLARQLAAFRELFRKLVLADETKPLPPTVMVLFRDDRSFRQVKPKAARAAGRYDGVTVRFEGRAIAAISAEFDDRTRRRIAFHEGVHWLLDESGTRPPLWLEEGLAEVFSTFEIADGKYGCGHPVPGHIETLREQPLWPLARLFAVDPQSPDYSETNTAGMFYAESWALAHLLLFGEEHRMFRRDAASRQDLLHGDREAIQQLLLSRLGGGPGAALEVVQRYVNSGRYVHFTGPYQAAEPGQFLVRPAPVVEIELAFGMLLAASDRPKEAEQRFRAAARARPQDPRPHEGLAVMAERQRRHGEAIEHYARAIARGSRNPYAHVAVAHDAIAAHELGGVSAGCEPRAAEWVKAYRELAGKRSATADLATGFANALFLSPEFVAEDCAEIEALTLRFPQRAELRYALALLWIRAGRLGEARTACERIVDDDHTPRDVRQAASYTLDQWRIDEAIQRAQRRLAAGDWAGAESTLGEISWERMNPTQRREAEACARAAADWRELQTAAAEIASRRFADARVRLRRLVAAPDRDAYMLKQARELTNLCELQELDFHYVERLNAAIERLNDGEAERGLAVLRAIADDPLAPERLRREARQTVQQAELGLKPATPGG